MASTSHVNNGSDYGSDTLVTEILASTQVEIIKKR